MKSGSAAVRLNVNFQLVPPRWLYFVMFTASGFSGLIYESIWSHYLKLFLGHAAYAQSLVLMIFMGGMAGGSWLASRYSNRWSAPLLAYAVVEAIIGLLALAFHDVFQGMIDSFYLSILPGMDSPALGSFLKWSAASLLIVPQSLLLGMTFPLMSAGILRRYPSTPGGSIAMLYFTNSIGAAAGVLASGFWLIGMVGLPGTIFTAGLMNIGLALIVFVMVKLDPGSAAPPLAEAAEQSPEDTRLAGLFLFAAFITGAASFIYEIGWIRMLSLVLGSTTHSFELMLSAFITGLAFGGLWIKRRIDDIKDPVAFSGGVQLLMGIVAVMTLPIYFLSFDWMQALMGAVSRSDSGFVAFSVGSHLIALAVMLPATFLAGMTLPLFTHVLLRKGAGEKAIGRVYAANTLGAIVGVLFAIHIGLPQLGVKSLIAFGASLDIVLGLFLLNYAYSGQRRTRVTAIGLLVVGVIATTLTVVDLNPARLASGVYRHGNADWLDEGEVLFYRDGKAASISLYRSGDNSISISTNGKPDASLFIDDRGEHTIDEITMALAAALPLAYKPDARVVGNIGLGSGLTSHTLLADPDIEVVDTIEIEPVMALAAQGFGERVARTFEDPRSNIHIEDAKTFFSLNDRRYDFIIAEPSNPWVSGVSSLFTKEFYRTVTNYIVDDGLFVQWLQLYEFEDRLIFSVLKALAPEFSDYAIFAAGGADILVVAKRNGSLGEPDTDKLMTGQMRDDLARIGLRSGDDILIRKLADKATIEAMFNLYRVPPNSDYYPYLDLNAGRARFKGETATLFQGWSVAPLPIMEMVLDQRPTLELLSPRSDFPLTGAAHNAMAIYSNLTGDAGVARAGTQISPLIYFAMQNAKLTSQQCIASRQTEWQSAWFRIAMGTLPYLDPDRAARLVEWIVGPDCATSMTPADRNLIDLYAGIARRDATAMATNASALLDAELTLTDPEFHAYVLTAGMLGMLQSDRAGAAMDMWRSYGEAYFSRGGEPGYTRLVRQLANRDAP
ncbi:MAG: fused MFS/spermidine synthase [Gammaproteobacteria bacterium]